MTSWRRQAGLIPPSTAPNPYPGRTPHWIKGNAAERIPHRWIVADTESRAEQHDGLEVQTFRLACATRWRDDLATGEMRQEADFTTAAQLWEWALDWCYTHGRTVLWFHNAGHDLAIADAFTLLPQLGCELVWCNLDREVSVCSWRTPGGTLVIADTYTWCPERLEDLGALVGIPKPRLPGRHASDAAWLQRCRADVAITEAVVRELLGYVRSQHLGNWQPSGAGMGAAAWRHRFMEHKVLVHDDADALEAEREAMHTGRAEAWWHGTAAGGPFTEWDMRQSYTTIARDCLLPAKLWDHDKAPSERVHRWALQHWRVLARVQVWTEAPVVPARAGGRIWWPVGTFATTLWDTELAQLEAAGGRYHVLEQWRYTRKPALAGWAAWTIEQVQLGRPAITEVQACWVKHQGRAVIGRFGLRTPSWECYSGNWLPGYTGLSTLTEEDGSQHRIMHVGSQCWRESGRAEANNSAPQITSWIMAEARSRLWTATLAAGQEHVLHTDTDSLIADKAGTAALKAAVAAGLPGRWRPKATWRQLQVIGPRHYHAPGKRQVPGVPQRAVRLPDGRYHGEVWDSLARTLAEGRSGQRAVRERFWEPAPVDHRRPYDGELDGPARPPRFGAIA